MSDRIHFDLGQVVATPGALDALSRNESDAREYLKRHASGDWGSACTEDKQANDEALGTGARILSVYGLADGTKIWVITDGTVDDQGTRPTTTILEPSDY
jgi:hypothetical protein